MYLFIVFISVLLLIFSIRLIFSVNATSLYQERKKSITNKIEAKGVRKYEMVSTPKGNIFVVFDLLNKEIWITINSQLTISKESIINGFGMSSNVNNFSSKYGTKKHCLVVDNESEKLLVISINPSERSIEHIIIDFDEIVDVEIECIGKTISGTTFSPTTLRSSTTYARKCKALNLRVLVRNVDVPVYIIDWYNDIALFDIEGYDIYQSAQLAKDTIRVIIDKVTSKCKIDTSEL
ncbi:hypothetical protein AAE250_02915 [Bacteroides sp. GD17]|jgi:hypothetical protein|uniref:hypothetical protein n=1 Tax=Bacteroides sp. GD17 TaxID=3139826 RepID=UPI00313AA7B4